MNSKEYVKSHDFGYGKSPEIQEINKLKLRNENDLKVYIEDTLCSQIKCKYNNQILIVNKTKYRINIEIC